MLLNMLVQGGVNGAATYATAGRPNGRLTVIGNGEGLMGVLGDGRFLAAAGSMLLKGAAPASARPMIENVGMGAAHSLVATEAIRAKGNAAAAAQPPAPEQLGYDIYGNAYDEFGNAYAADPSHVYG